MIEHGRMRGVLLDTGPLVAILAPHDCHHESCVESLTRIALPLLTCWPVLTEAAWLLRNDRAAIREMLAGVERGELAILELAVADLAAINRLLLKYDDLKPQLADVALVHLAEREGLDTVFTLDRRDFSIYRLKGKKAWRLIPDPVT